MTMKKKVIIIQALLILIFLFCAGYTGKYFYDSHMAQKEFESISEEVRRDMPVDASGNYEEKYADNGMLLGYYDLYTQNNDLTGWISIPDTVIDYPVVQAEDNEYYLHRDFYKNYQYSGIPFLDSDSAANSFNRIIYAHNMRNGTMFAAIAKYDDEEFYNSHKKLKYDTLYERGEYDIISVFRTKVGAKDEFKYYEYADIEDETRFNEYVERVKSLSQYNTGRGAQFGDTLVTLSTCAYHTSNERIVIVARKKNG